MITLKKNGHDKHLYNSINSHAHHTIYITINLPLLVDHLQNMTKTEQFSVKTKGVSIQNLYSIILYTALRE